MTKEKTILSKRRDGRNCASKSIVGWANYCAVRQLRTDKFAGNGEDQTGLNQAGRLQRWVGEKVRKRQASIRHRRHRGLHSIARKIYPFQEVRNLVSTNAKCDFQYFQAAHFLTKRLIQARSALFDVAEVKRCSVGDHLNVVGIVEVGIRNRDRSAVSDVDCLRKRGAKSGFVALRYRTNQLVSTFRC